jgi:hypothetical protein
MGSHTDARPSSSRLRAHRCTPPVRPPGGHWPIFLRILAAQNFPPSEPQRLRVSMATSVYSDQKPVAVRLYVCTLSVWGRCGEGGGHHGGEKGIATLDRFAGLAHTARPRTPHLSTRYCNRRLKRRLFFIGCQSSPAAEVSNGRPAFAPCRTRTSGRTLPILARRCATRAARGGLSTFGNYKRWHGREANKDRCER